MKDIQISEFKKRITEWEVCIVLRSSFEYSISTESSKSHIDHINIVQNKLKQQQQLYETVRADRNHYSKGLLESQDEIAELKKKFKIMGHQIEQLKGSTD